MVCFPVASQFSQKSGDAFPQIANDWSTRSWVIWKTRSNCGLLNNGWGPNQSVRTARRAWAQSYRMNALFAFAREPDDSSIESAFHFCWRIAVANLTTQICWIIFLVDGQELSLSLILLATKHNNKDRIDKMHWLLLFRFASKFNKLIVASLLLVFVMSNVSSDILMQSRQKNGRNKNNNYSDNQIM